MTIKAVFLSVFLWLGVPCMAVAQEGPEEFVRNMNAHVKQLISEGKLDQLPKVIEGVLAREMIAKFVLGRYRHDLSDAQFKDFIDYYGDYLVQLYIDRLASYSGEMKILSNKELSLNRYLVRTVVAFNKSHFALDYILVKRDNNKYYLLDVIAEGIRLSYTSREELQQFIEQHGLKSLRSELLKKLGK